MTHHWQPLNEGESQGAWLRTGAAALLAGVATYFAGDAVWRPTYDQFVARAVVAYSPAADHTSSLDLDAARAQLTSDRALQAAIDGSGNPSLTPAMIRPELSVFRQFDASDGRQQRMAIELAGDQEQSAAKIVDRLSRQFVESHARHGGRVDLDNTSDLAIAQAKLAQAQTREDAARRVLDSLTRQHFENVRSLEKALPDIEPEPTPAVRRGTQDNPLRQKLRDQIKTLELKRDDLLAKLTSEHPLVQDVNVELLSLNQRLQDLGAQHQDQLAPPALHDTAPLREGLAEVQSRLRTASEQEAKYRAAVEACEAARNERLEAQAAVEVLSAAPTTASGEAKYVLDEPAQIVDRVPSVQPVVRSGVLILLGTVASLLVLAVLRPRSAQREKLATAEDVERLLGVPVIAKLPRPSHAA